jgi:hypothetical protein
LPGYNGKAQANMALSGNNVAIAIGDIVVAFAQTVGHQIPMGGTQLYGVGTSKPQEIQQLIMSPQVSLDSFALTQQGVVLLSANTDLFFSLAGFVYDIHLLDGTVQPLRTMLSYIGCKAQNAAESIPTNAPIRRTITFLAMDVLDPNGNSVISAQDNAISVASGVLSVGLAAAGLGVGP